MIQTLIIWALFLPSLWLTQTDKSISGSYRLKYYPKINNKTGWDYNQIQREELITINSNNNYKIEHIYPLGGFEIVPDTGKCEINNDTILLESYLDKHTRTFKITANGLMEQNCQERGDLCNIILIKEE